MKMIPPSGSRGFVHTANRSYSTGAGAVEVHDGDVAELQALGWGAPLEANSPEKIPTHEENALRLEAARRSMWRKLQHPEVRTRMALAPGGKRDVTIEGRRYQIPAGQDYLDVPTEDVRSLVCNAGWLDWGLVGPTEDRPVKPMIMQNYIDTDVEMLLFFDGQEWRDPVTGEVI